MKDKKSIEELRAEAKRLRELRDAKVERETLEKEVKELRSVTGQQPLARKALGAVVKGAKALGKQVASDMEAIGKELSEEEQPKKRAKKDE